MLSIPAYLRRRAFVSKASFEVAYDGPALTAGEMDVRQLAPALLSIGEMVVQASRVVNGDRAEVTVRIRPITRSGSLPIDLNVAVGLADQVQALVGPHTLADAHELLALIGFLDPKGKIKEGISVVRNVLELLKLTSGKTPERVSELPNNMVSITIAGDSLAPIVVSNDAFKVAADPRFRKQAGEALKPLRSQGIDSFQVRDGGRVLEEITRENVPFVEIEASPPSDDPGVVDAGEYTPWVTVKRPHFQEEGKRWDFDDGGNGFSALVTDQSFWERVHADEVSISEHTQFRVRVKWEQRRLPDGKLTRSFEVTEVLESKRPGRTSQDAFFDVP